MNALRKSMTRIERRGWVLGGVRGGTWVHPDYICTTPVGSILAIMISDFPVAFISECFIQTPPAWSRGPGTEKYKRIESLTYTVHTLLLFHFFSVYVYAYTYIYKYESVLKKRFPIFSYVRSRRYAKWKKKCYINSIVMENLIIKVLSVVRRQLVLALESFADNFICNAKNFQSNWKIS